MVNAAFDPLWVPILSHYRHDGGEVRLDPGRVGAHLRAILPEVRQYLVAGTTGDGWQMPDAILDQWLELLCDPALVSPAQRFIVGAFGQDSAAVCARAERIERHFGDHPPAARFAGLTVCAPVKPGASQAEIKAHIRVIAASTSAPLAVYQLPQITGCEIAPETFAELAAEEPRIFLFKDTSGADRIAEAGLPVGRARLLRGAEGDYARHLAPTGRYDGWLLSTANGFGADLRHIATAARAGDTERAAAQSAALARTVATLFAEAAKLGGNAFADVSRAVDHLRAFGSRWRGLPAPLRGDGSPLPIDFLSFAEAVVCGGRPAVGGYLAA